MSLWFVGLGRGVLKAIWDKNQLFLNKTFILCMYKVEHPYPTVTSQSLSDSNQPGSVQLVKSMPEKLVEVIQSGGTLSTTSLYESI
jgi:hypothetical protein